MTESAIHNSLVSNYIIHLQAIKIVHFVKTW